jgi:DNA-binding HxlR family transcriptional regulator
MAAMDLLGRRWALRILWELRHEPLGARALRSRCDQMSSSVLYERLGELTDAGLVSRDETGAYLLTGLGASLGSALEPLNAWAGRWSDSQQQADHEEGTAGRPAPPISPRNPTYRAFITFSRQEPD